MGKRRTGTGNGFEPLSNPFPAEPHHPKPAVLTRHRRDLTVPGLMPLSSFCGKDSDYSQARRRHTKVRGSRRLPGTNGMA